MRDKGIVLERLWNRPRLHVIGGTAWRLDPLWFRSRLRVAATVAIALHLAGAAAFVVRFPRRPPPNVRFSSIPVDLVSVHSPGGRGRAPVPHTAGTKTPPKPKPQEKPERAKGKIPPPDVKNARPVPSKKAGRPQAEPNEPDASTPILREEIPLAGGAQGALEMTVDGPISAYSYYLMTVRDKVASHWAPPAGLVSGGKEIAAVVNFRIDRSGNVTASYVEEPSGAGPFDASGLRAIADANPLPPLPQEFPGDWLGIHLRFVYNEE